MFNYKTGMFLREQSREKPENDINYGLNKADRAVLIRSVSYLEKTIDKVGSKSHIQLIDLPDQSPVASDSMSFITTQCAAEHIQVDSHS